MKLLSLLQDDTGSLSSQRAFFLAFGVAFIGLWVMQSIHEMKMAEIPMSCIGVLVAALTGKVTQSITENMGSKTTDLQINK